MFDYFRNCSSNAHLACCEDCPTKVLCNLFFVRWPCPSFKVTTASHTYACFNMHFNYNISDIIYAIAFKLGMTETVCIAYMLLLVSMTFTLMQSDSGTANAMQTNQHWIISTTKQAVGSKLVTTVGHYYLFTDLDFENVYMAWPSSLRVPDLAIC